MKLCVVGLGYIGLPTALLFAEAGCIVRGFDIDTRKLALLRKHSLPFEEQGLQELYDKVKDNFVPIDTLEEADAYIICVPTPITSAHVCDDSYVRRATEAVAPWIRKGTTVVLESTVVPGTTSTVVRSILETYGFVAGRDFHLGYVSEKAIPGNTLYEMRHNDRIVAGVDEMSTKNIRDLYALFVRGEIHITDCTTAETVKLVENAYRDVNISFANELTKLCASLGLNVWQVIRLANKHPRVNVHSPGPGVGGHCIGLDPWFLAQVNPQESALIRQSRTINNSMPTFVADTAIRLATKYGTRTIGILGVAYKKNVDDARETPAIPIIAALQREGYTVLVHDPLVKHFDYSLVTLETILAHAEGILLITDHDAYQSLHFALPQRWLYDTRGLYEGKDIGIDYYLLGTGMVL